MVAKLGRPTNNPKNSMLRVRVDTETLNKLDKCVELLHSNRSVVIRKGIDKMFDDLIKKI